MKISKTGYKKNSKDKNEPALVIPSNKITMKGVEFPVYGTDDTGYSQMMYPGLDYSYPGSYVRELPMAKNGMSAPGPSKVIGGKLEVSYDKDRNIYLKALDAADWNKIEGDRAKEFRTKFAEYLPGYFDPAGSIKQISKKAAKELSTRQQIVADTPKYGETVQETTEMPQAPQAAQSKQRNSNVPPLLALSAAQPTFGDTIISQISNPQKLEEAKLQSKYQRSEDYHITPYNSVNQANKEYEKTVDYKLRYKNLDDYSAEDIPKIQEKLYNKGYLEKPEQIDLTKYSSKEQLVELQTKLFKYGLGDVLGKIGPNQDGITGVINDGTKKAVQRFNELNKTYKEGELDTLTKEAIKTFKGVSDAKNAIGLSIVDPKKLYDPSTGEPYIDETYEAMDIFENSLKSKGYFLGNKDYDTNESVASNPKIAYSFKLNPDPTTPFEHCAEYLNGTICKEDAAGEAAREELGLKGDAWHVSENIQDKGGQLIFSGLPDRSTLNLNGKSQIRGYLKSQLTSPDVKNQLQSLSNSGNIRPGDVVNIFYDGSGFLEQAYNQTKSLNNRFFTTHVGIIKGKTDDKGNETLFVEHNIHGQVHKDPLQDFIDGKITGNSKVQNSVSLIAGVTRPKYVDGIDQNAKIPVAGIPYYQTEEGQVNPKGLLLRNSSDYLGQSISGEKTHKYLTTIEKNKDKLLKDIPISDTEFGKLMRMARVIPTKETYGGQNAEEEQTLVYKIAKSLKDITSEKSTGFTKLKDSSNLGEDLRRNLYQDNDSELTNPVKAALPTFYLLSKNYLYLKEVANKNNIDVTTDELAKLAGLSYNQSIGKIAGELIDKGSYQNYYDYRVKTATDPGGQFKYREALDMYDTQTMKEGGMILPGRFKNPEGNWISKYENGGWLDKYQGDKGSSQVKTYKSDPSYFDNRAVFVDNPQANDLVRSKVYAGTHGWDPTTNSLIKLDKPVVVPEVSREMSTADYGKKNYKERFESNTPAGKEVRKAAVAQGMKDMVQNPLLYAPGVIAAGALAAPLAAPALAGVSGALSAPLTIGSTVIPGVTMGNTIAAGFASDAIVNRLPQIPGQLGRGEYLDAGVNALTGALDLYTAGMVSPLFKGAKQLLGSPVASSVDDIGKASIDEIMSLSAPKGNMYGQNQVLTQQARLLDPKIKAKFFKNQAILPPPPTSILEKIPKDYNNRITPENYDDFVKKIHGSTDYDLAATTGKQPHNLGIGSYGKPGMVYKDASLNNLGKDIIAGHEKNHGMFAGTMSEKMTSDLLKPFGTNKPIPHYAQKHQGDEVFGRMAQFKNAIGIGDNQTFTLGHLNLIRKNYANSFIDNGITEMLSKLKPGSAGEKEFLINMNKYAFTTTGVAIGTGVLRYIQQPKEVPAPDFRHGGWLEQYQDGGSKAKNFRRSVDSEYTKDVQKMLNQSYDTGLSIDGVWGPLTEKAYQNHLEINNLQNQINKLDNKQQAFKNQDNTLKKVNISSKKSSTSVVLPKAENAKKQIESVQREAARVKSKMQETGAKSEAEVYAREKEMVAAQAKLTNQPVLKPAEDKSAEDYLSHVWDIASNPVTAFGYKARGEEIPWGFSQGDRNPLEYATDVINPAFYANAAGRLTNAATTGSTYTKTIPQALGATAGLLMNEEVPEEWNDEAIKTLGILGDATVVSQGLKAVSEVSTAIRNAKSSNFLNVKQEHTFPGLSNPKVAGNLSLKYNTPLPDHHFKDSGEFLDWYKKTQNNRPFTKKEINFLNKELKERGILEVQRSNPLNPLPNLTRRMLIPEDYNFKKVVSDAAPNLVKSFKGMDNIYKDYTMGPGRLNAFNQWLGLPTKGTMYRIHPESFQNGQELLYTTTGNSMKGVFDPELKKLVPKSQSMYPIGKETFDELDIAIKAGNKAPYQKELQELGYTDLKEFEDLTGVSVSRRPNTVGDWDKYTGSAGGTSWTKVPIKGGGYEWTMRDKWDIEPFSRMSRMPKFVRDIDVANLIGAKNFNVNWNYKTSPKFNKVSNIHYPGNSWSVKKNGGVKSQGEGYYDYINGYSGIFANGGSKGWLDKYN